MPETTAVKRWGEGVDISSPKLVNLEFHFEDVELPEDLQIEYSLGLNRFSATRLGVQFGASIPNVPGLTAKAVYRMIFTLKPGFPETEDPEGAFAQIVARMAPVAMYPFVREAFASLAQKALLTPIILPVQNIGALWKVGEVPLPPVPDEQTDD